jgi:hypothetical protein
MPRDSSAQSTLEAFIISGEKGICALPIHTLESMLTEIRECNCCVLGYGGAAWHIDVCVLVHYAQDGYSRVVRKVSRIPQFRKVVRAYQ